MQNSGSGQGATKRTTFIEEGSAFKGEFSSDCPIVVKGRIEGNITGPSLTVTATGAVAGNVKVGGCGFKIAWNRPASGLGEANFKRQRVDSNG